MLRRSILPALLLLALPAAGCELLVDPIRDRTPPRDLTAQESRLVRSDNRFGLKLFGRLNAEPAERPRNVFISPLSVSIALGMTLNGAAGETQRDMEATLELAGLSSAEINEGYRSLTELLTGLDPKVAFRIANSIWYRQGFAVEQTFVDLNRQYFDAEVQALDFGSPQAVRTINGWVDEQTEGKIDEIIREIDPAVVMYLINAIYFKGDWRYRFEEEDTRPAPFHAPGGPVEVPMMRQETTLPYYAGDGFRAVDLPYGDSLFTMTVLLPDPGREVDSLVARLDEARWNEIAAGFHPAKVRLGLPRFTLEYDVSLVDVLSALGMEVAFTTRADFTKINPHGGLLISDVIHKTFVDVNEEGTEAAAVTAVIIERTSVEVPVVFEVDRPFVFAIRERHSGTILFIGKILNPKT